MNLSPSWEAASRSSTQELRIILWNTLAQDRIRKNAPPNLSWARSIHCTLHLPISLRSIVILSTHPRLSVSLCIYLLPVHNTLHVRPSHCSDLIIIIILGVEYKLWSFWLSSYLQSLIAYSTSAQIFSLIPCFKHFQSVFVPYRTIGMIAAFYILMFTFCTADGKTKAPGLSGSTYNPNSMSS